MIQAPFGTTGSLAMGGTSHTRSAFRYHFFVFEEKDMLTKLLIKGRETCTIYVRETSSPFNASSKFNGDLHDHASEQGRLSDEILFAETNPDLNTIAWSPDSKGLFYMVFGPLFIVALLSH